MVCEVFPIRKNLIRNIVTDPLHHPIIYDKLSKVTCVASTRSRRNRTASTKKAMRGLNLG